MVGTNARLFIILFAVFGFTGMGWIGSKIDHGTIFLGLWSALLAALGAIVGAFVGNFIGRRM